MKLRNTRQNLNGTYYTPSDYNRSELATLAKKAIAANAGIETDVLFKYTCPECGERNFCETVNVMPSQVQCPMCDHVSPFSSGGFALRHNLTPDRTGPPVVLVALPDDMAKSKSDAESNANKVTSAFGMDNAQSVFGAQ